MQGDVIKDFLLLQKHRHNFVIIILAIYFVFLKGTFPFKILARKLMYHGNAMIHNKKTAKAIPIGDFASHVLYFLMFNFFASLYVQILVLIAIKASIRVANTTGRIVRIINAATINMMLINQGFIMQYNNY